MRATVRLLADRHIPLTPHMLPEGVSLTRYDPVEGLPKEFTQFDALFTRTVTSVNKSTFSDDPGKIRFIGSATAGHDHVDREWLASRGVEFAWAPGCNARSVAEYVAVSVVLWARKSGATLQGLQAGIVGSGHSGRATAEALERLGLKTIHYDPPREERRNSFRSASLPQLLRCDLITLHTPLERQGAWPTRHWLDHEKLQNGPFRLVINAARGGVVDEEALHYAFREKRLESYVLDVWEGEPRFRDPVARDAMIATPHIAGYSIQAKKRASRLVIEAFCRCFKLQAPPPDENEEVQSLSGTFTEDNLTDLLLELHPIGTYDRLFREMIGTTARDKALRFPQIRTATPLRHEHTSLALPPRLMERFPVLKALGFRSK